MHTLDLFSLVYIGTGYYDYFQPLLYEVDSRYSALKGVPNQHVSPTLL